MRTFDIQSPFTCEEISAHLKKVKKAEKKVEKALWPAVGVLSIPTTLMVLVAIKNPDPQVIISGFATSVFTAFFTAFMTAVFFSHRENTRLANRKSALPCFDWFMWTFIDRDLLSGVEDDYYPQLKECTENNAEIKDYVVAVNKMGR